jgi:hypothetical protein
LATRPLIVVFAAIGDRRIGCVHGVVWVID